MRGPISKPVNSIQTEFNKLCELGGGRGGGPAKGKVVDLLHFAGTSLNRRAYRQVADHFTALSDRNPWHVCYALGLCWGHLAKLELDFTDAATRLMENWNDADLRSARHFQGYRGPEVIEDSLRGGKVLFDKVVLPLPLPGSLQKLRDAQNRWLSPILSKDRPRYVGAWNATAMFMVSLFAQPSLASSMQDQAVQLPPSGSVYKALAWLNQVKFLLQKPDGGPLDDEAFEPGVLATNNGLFVTVRENRNDWSTIDVHSGLYMIGTGLPESEGWLEP